MLLFLGFNTSARYATIIGKKKIIFYFLRKVSLRKQTNQDKPLSRKRVDSKYKSIQSLRLPTFGVLKIKNAEVYFEN